MEQPLDNQQDNLIPRSEVFVLLDGTFVVRWSENRVQELQTGRYRTYDRQDFGAPITDYELKQLKDVGLVDHYDDRQVWLTPAPERSDLDWLASWEQRRTRSYYLQTTLPGSLLQDIIDLLDDLNLTENFQARIRDDFVVMWSARGVSFPRFDDAEKARIMLESKAPEAFGNTVVAFVETTRRG
jgi:hypothetical protein